MRIGDLGRDCGVNPKTVRYYEALGLLPRPTRAASGHRMYTRQDVERLRFIRRAKAIGLPLASIRQIARYAEGGACEHLRPRLKALIAAQLAEVEIRMRELRALARELRRHHQSLDEPPARHARQTPCSCLADARAQQILPRAALVKRPAGRKS
jgi:DNA-binding transcriptional MerR regulator